MFICNPARKSAGIETSEDWLLSCAFCASISDESSIFSICVFSLLFPKIYLQASAIILRIERPLNHVKYIASNAPIKNSPARVSIE